jgi:hypothetical protein
VDSLYVRPPSAEEIKAMSGGEAPGPGGQAPSGLYAKRPK